MVVDPELHPGLHARDAVAPILAPRVEQRLHHRHRILDRDPHAEVARQPRHRREPAAHPHGEPVHAVPHQTDQRDAVDLRHVALRRARTDRDLVLARQVHVHAVPVEEPRRLVDHRRHVERLAGQHALQGAPGDVPDRVAARSRGGQPRRREFIQDRRHVREPNEVQLDVLPGRQLGRPLAVPLRDRPDRPQPRGRQHTRGDLDPEHERPDLGLVVVQPVPLQPDELLLGDVEVVGRGQRRQILQRIHRGTVPLQPLDRVALEDLVPRGLGPKRTAFAAPVFPVLRHRWCTPPADPSPTRERKTSRLLVRPVGGVRSTGCGLLRPHRLLRALRQARNAGTGAHAAGDHGPDDSVAPRSNHELYPNPINWMGNCTCNVPAPQFPVNRNGGIPPEGPDATPRA